MAVRCTGLTSTDWVDGLSPDAAFVHFLITIGFRIKLVPQERCVLRFCIGFVMQTA